MAIYGRPVDSLTTADLAALLTDGAVENVRLEFKRDVPSKDETLKKLSSFANTYGGYMIIGAAAGSADGKLTGLPGVPPASGLKQTIVQWCFDGLYPPLEPDVSPPIPSPNDPTRSCYVVYVEESLRAPHFINGRQGAYVRTNEFSQRFTPELATYDELEHLADRRATLVQRRSEMLAASKRRFGTFTALKYHSTPGVEGSIGATAALSVCPTFPADHLVSPSDLFTALTSLQLNWRQGGFPRVADPVTQLNSVLLLNASWGFSLLEVTTHGHIYYAREVEEIRLHDEEDPTSSKVHVIHLWSFLGTLLISLKHASALYGKLGYSGTLRLNLDLQGIRELPFADWPHGTMRLGPVSPFDDVLSISYDTSTNSLATDPEATLKDLTRTVFFALNWRDAARDSQALDENVAKARGYNDLR